MEVKANRSAVQQHITQVNSSSSSIGGSTVSSISGGNAYAVTHNNVLLVRTKDILDRYAVILARSSGEISALTEKLLETDKNTAGQIARNGRHQLTMK